MTTLQDAIKHADDVAHKCCNTECGDEHAHLSQWLVELQRTRSALQTAMTVLDQIATTPRNRGAKRSAHATVVFLRALLATPDNAVMTGPQAPSP